MTQIKHIAILTDNFPPCSGGGIAEWALGIAENLSQLDFEVSVLSRWKKQVPTDDHIGKPYTLHCMYGRDWNKRRFWFVLYYLWKFLKTHPDALILATTWELAHPMVILKRFFPEAKYVVIAHGREVTKLKKPSELKPFRKTIPGAVLSVAVSQFTKQEILDRLGTSYAKVEFLPNAVNTERFYPTSDYASIQKKLGIKSDNKIILTLARVIERKGHDTVIQALPKIIAKHPETLYVIAGPWKEPFYKKLKKLIDELGLEKHVIFTSFVDEQDLNRFYSLCDVYVMVSRVLEKSGDSEGFGITFLEANACLCPVIGSYSGGIPDAVEDGVSGFLIQPDDPEALSEKINLLFDDPDLKENMARQGRERVEAHYTWKKITNSLVELIQQALKD